MEPDHDEKVERKLDAYIRWVQEILARYDGVLIQLTIGDKGSYFSTVFGVPLKEGLPVALALNVSNAPSGCIYHVRSRTICLRELRTLVPTAIVGVMVGVWLAHVAPSQVLRVVFGFVLLLLAVRLVRDA